MFSSEIKNAPIYYLLLTNNYFFIRKEFKLPYHKQAENISENSFALKNACVEICIKNYFSLPPFSLKITEKTFRKKPFHPDNKFVNTRKSSVRAKRAKFYFFFVFHLHIIFVKAMNSPVLCRTPDSILEFLLLRHTNTN